MSDTLRTAVIGLGRLGLPMACVLSRNVALDVVGVDLRHDLIEDLGRGVVTLPEPGIDISKLTFTTDMAAAMKDTQIVFVVVNTPTTDDGPNALDHGDVNKALSAAVAASTGPMTIVLVSTVEPRPLLAMHRMLPMRHTLVYQPQFIALGSVVDDLVMPDMALYGIVAADNRRAHSAVDRVEAVWAGAGCREHWGAFPQGCTKSRRLAFGPAAVVKMALNAWLCQQAAFGQAVTMAVEALGGDGLSARQALNTDSRFSDTYAKGRYPYGGPCFPKDLRSFGRICKTEIGTDALAKGVFETNVYAGQALFDEIVAHTREDSHVGLIGLAYKPGTEVIQDSPAIELARQLLQANRRVAYHDPLVQAPPGLLRMDSPEDLGRWSHVIVLMHPDKDRGEVAGHHGPSTIIIDPWDVLTRDRDSYRSSMPEEPAA